MFQATEIFKRRSPTLLLLGLLALLLWGQCAALLFPGTMHQPAEFIGSVKRLDSLGTAPVALYLTLCLRNDLSQPTLVREVRGTIRYGSRAYTFTAPTALRDTFLFPWTELLQPVAVPLPHLAADSLALLRTLLETGYPAPGAPRLQWQVSYSLRESPGSRRKARTLSYLPLLQPTRAVKGRNQWQK